MYEFKNFTLTVKNRELFTIPYLKLPSCGIVLLRGENGTGKSTFLNCLAFLSKSYKGDMFFCGKNKFSQKEIEEILSDKVSYIRQKNNGVSFLSADANKNLPSIIKGEVKRYKSPKMEALSQGQQMKLILEREFATAKKVFLLDESFSSLDKHNRENLKCELIRKKQECLFILVSHEGVMEEESDCIYEIHDRKWRMIR